MKNYYYSICIRPVRNIFHAVNAYVDHQSDKIVRFILNDRVNEWQNSDVSGVCAAYGCLRKLFLLLWSLISTFDRFMPECGCFSYNTNAIPLL